MATNTRTRRSRVVEPVEQVEQVETEQDLERILDEHLAEVAQEAEEAKPEPKAIMTPYQATKRVNEALKEAGVDRVVRSPMLYIYAGKGKFQVHKAVKVTKAGKEKSVWEIDEESFVAWMAEYVAGAAGRKADAVELQEVAEEESAKVDVAEGHEDDGITTDEVEAE
jgi:hypothetical protein